MSTKFLSPGWRMPRNANQSKQANYSMYGDATGEINIADAPLSSESWTIAVWLKPSVTTGTEIIWDMQYGSAGGFKLIHQYGTSSTTAVWFLYYAPTYSNFSSQVTITRNNWHHVIVRYNKGVDYRIYVDGVFSGSSTTFNNYSYPTTRDLEIFKIGGFNGNLDQFCIFNYALSDTSTTVGDTATGQVAAIYGDGSSIPNPMSFSNPPIAYYPLGTSAYNGEYLAENNAIGDYVFDFTAGFNEYINLGNNSVLQPTSNYTFSIWFNADSYSYKTLFGSNTAYNEGGVLALPLSNNSMSYYHAHSGTAAQNFSISLTDAPINNWHNFTVTWSASTGIIRAFINGKFKAELIGVNDITWGNELLIGRYYQTYPFLFEGKLSNFAMWNTTLTDGFSGTPSQNQVAGGQVAEVYNNGSPQTTITGSPVGWWKLDASATYDSSNWSIPDDSTNSNTGTSSGMSQTNLIQSDLQTVAPYSKYALDFDGINDYITIPNSTDFDYGTGDFTWSFWLNIDTHVNYAGLFYFASSGVPYRLKIQSDSTIYLDTGNNDIQIANLGIGLAGSGWHSLVFTRSSGTIKTYLNGGQVDSVSYNYSLNSNGLPLIIGDNAGSYLNGKLSNISIWNTALTSSQVTEIYNEGLPSNLNSHSAYSNLISWWQLGENSSFDGNNWIVADEMPAGNNGTSTGMPVGALTNGVGTTANGVSSGMSEGNLVGDAPYSTANALSTNMAVTARVTGSGNTP